MRWLPLLAVVLVGVLAFWSVPVDKASLERSYSAERDEPSLPERAPELKGVTPSSSTKERPTEKLVPTTGRILWPDGAPYRSDRAHLTVLDERGRRRTPALDPSGRFRFDAPRGEGQLVRLDQEDGRSILHVCDWEVAGGTQGVELKIPAMADTPFGVFRVEDDRGQPVPSAKVTLHVLGQFGAQIERVCRVREGWARIVFEVAARRVVACVSHAEGNDGQRLATRAFGPLVLGGDPHILRLEPARSLKVLVVDEAGESIERVEVALELLPPLLNWVGDFHVVASKTDEEGHATIHGLGSERYELRVAPPVPWLTPAYRTLRLGAGVERVVLRRGVLARIRVVDPDGEPLRGSEIATTPDAHVRRWWTGDDGTVLVGPLAEAIVHRIHVWPPSDRRRERRMREQAERARSRFRAVNRLQPEPPARRLLLEGAVEDWQPKDITVRLEWDEEPLPAPPPEATEPDTSSEGASLKLRVRTPRPDDLGELPDGELVRDDQPGDEPREVSFALGSAWAEDARAYAVTEAIEGLDRDATYTLRIAGAQDGWALEARGLKPGPVLHDLELDRGLVIRGRLVLPAGTDYVSIDASCGRLRVMGSFAGATVLPDGRVEIPGLVSGLWHLDFSARAGGEWFGAEVDVEPGDEFRVRLERLE